jgi:hypothetical protein
MSVQNITITRDSVSENELDGTAIEKFPQGTALSNLSWTKLSNNLLFKKSGQNLDLEENENDLEDPDEDSSQNEEIEKPLAKAKAKSTPRKRSVEQRKAQPTDFKRKEWAYHVIVKVGIPTSKELAFEKNFNKAITAQAYLLSQQRSEFCGIKQLVSRTIPIDFHDARTRSDVVELLADAVVVPLDHATRHQTCLSKALL